MEGPRLSKYIRSPGHKSYKVCVMPYRKGPALRRRASSWWKTTGIGLELDFNFQSGSGSHRVYLYDEHRCSPTAPLRAHLPDSLVQRSLSIMEREKEDFAAERQAASDGSSSSSSGLDDVKEDELSSAEEARMLANETAGFHWRL